MNSAQGDGWAECNDAGDIAPWGDTTGGTGAGPGAELSLLPRVPASVAPRPRQLRRLDRLAALTIVEAPPGFGKTTLAVAWAQHLAAAGTRVIWVDATDHPDDQAASLDVARRAHAGRSVVVVDDAHLVRDPVVADSLVRLVRRDRNVHVLVLADTHHPFSLAAARHGQEATHLRTADLELLAHEIPDFAAAWGHHVSGDDAEKLHAMVGGWPLPLRLVLDATPAGTGVLTTSWAQQFVTNRVLPLVAGEVEVPMAARLAVPAHLRTDLAVAIVQDSAQVADSDAREVADALLTTLEAHGLLRRTTRRDGPAQWTYLPLVRSVLLELLERGDPDTASRVHRQVAHVLGASGKDADAELLHHARSGEDWSLLADLWSAEGWTLVDTEEVAFQHAYGAIPAQAQAEHPRLTLATSVADALAATQNLDAERRAETALHHYARSGTDMLGRERPAHSAQHAAEVLTAAMVARRGSGDLAQARRMGREAGRELVQAGIDQPGRHQRSQVAWFHLQSAFTDYMSGDVPAAVEHALTAHRFGPHTLLGVTASGVLAVLHTLEADTAESRRWLATHESTVLRGTWAPHAQLPGRLARTMLALDRLDREAAEAELAQVPLGPETCGLWLLTVLAHQRHALMFGDPMSVLSRVEHLRRVRAAHLRDERSTARRVLDRCTVDLWLALSEVNRVEARLKEASSTAPWLLAPAARLHLMTGNPRKASRVAAAAVWRDDVDVRDRTELLVTAAVAAHELGDTTQAHQMFRRAHVLSSDTGNAQPLLQIPVDVRRELLHGTGLRLDPEILSRLDAARTPYPQRAELVRLSPREQEVLRQLARHRTTSDIARTLTVSVNTVKKQLVSLYVKLGVSDRASALLRAEALGLLDASPDTDHGR
ncbi:hypothetical protein GCM10023339_07620 [Alloalcanivorax gelatiniphagus]